MTKIKIKRSKKVCQEKMGKEWCNEKATNGEYCLEHAKENYPTCDKCEELANYNLQNVWKLYDILPNGEYSSNPKEWEGDSNEHLCESCYKKEIE